LLLVYPFPRRRNWRVESRGNCASYSSSFFSNHKVFFLFGLCGSNSRRSPNPVWSAMMRLAVSFFSPALIGPVLLSSCASFHPSSSFPTSRAFSCFLSYPGDRSRISCPECDFSCPRLKFFFCSVSQFFSAGFPSPWVRTTVFLASFLCGASHSSEFPLLHSYGVFL